MKYGGWSDQGMTHFNELFDLVKKDRKYPQWLLQWKRSFWNVPFGTLLTASEEEQNQMWQQQLLENWLMCEVALFNQQHGSQMMRVLASSEHRTFERV